jgi:hypothetical protein
MKTYGGSGGNAPSILNLSTTWSWVVIFTPWPIYSQEKSPPPPRFHWIGFWVGPRAGLEAVAKKIPWHCRESYPGRPTYSLVCILGYSGSRNIVSLTKNVCLTWPLPPSQNCGTFHWVTLNI